MPQNYQDEENGLENLVARIVESVQPSQESVKKGIAELRAGRAGLTETAVAELWAERICRFYAAEGAASALPSVIPGLGTAVQIAIEGGTIAADLAYMIRCMADIVMGVGHAYGRTIEQPFKEDFVQVLGIWCGAITFGKEAAVRVASKVAMSQAKRVPAEMFKRFNRNLGQHVITQVGLRRGGVTLGRLIPFGVGALVGGGFNYATMRSFKNTTLEYFSGED